VPSRAKDGVPDRAVQLPGGYGHVSDYPVERMMRDAKIAAVAEGLI
jgi:alkylation response protein AidB-like acyl-CoA dehydrogenase